MQLEISTLCIICNGCCKIKFSFRKLCQKKGDRAVSRDRARGKQSGGTVARTVPHNSKLKSKLQIGAPGKKHLNLAKNARTSLFYSIRGSASKK